MAEVEGTGAAGEMTAERIAQVRRAVLFARGLRALCAATGKPFRIYLTPELTGLEPWALKIAELAYGDNAVGEALSRVLDALEEREVADAGAAG